MRLFSAITFYAFQRSGFMRRTLTAFIILSGFYFFPAKAQIRQRSEVGGGIGTFNYTGDLVRTYNIRYSRPGATVFYRHNFSHVVSVRTGLTFGRVAASDLKDPIDLAAKERGASFDIGLLELAPIFEYHFIDWKDAKRRIRYTPYLFAGAGLFVFSGNKEKPEAYSNVQASIPLGGGFKYILNPHWYLGLEIGIRKTFFDYLDNVSDRARPQKRPLESGNPYDKDNYFFIGFSLTRTFYDIPCATSPY